MKIFIICLLTSVCFYNATAQEKQTTILVDKIENDRTELTNNMFRYKEYTNGKVIFKDNTAADARMNFNQLTVKMLFIGPKGDTLEFARPETFDMIIVDRDSFYVNDGNYYEKLTHYPAANLALVKTLRLIGVEKKGAYGTYSATSATTSYTNFTSDDQLRTTLNTDERIIFKFNKAYFISDKNNIFLPATRKNLARVFSGHDKEIKAFLDSNNLSINKQDDLLRLFQYCQRLQ